MLLWGWGEVDDHSFFLDVQVPLMRDPQSGGVLCVNCQAMSSVAPPEPAEWQGCSQGKHRVRILQIARTACS